MSKGGWSMDASEHTHSLNYGGAASMLWKPNSVIADIEQISCILIYTNEHFGDEEEKQLFSSLSLSIYLSI